MTTPLVKKSKGGVTTMTIPAGEREARRLTTMTTLVKKREEKGGR